MPLILFHEILLDPDLVQATNGQALPVSGFPECMNEHVTNAKTGVTKTNIGRLDPLEMLNVDLQLLGPTKRKYFLNFYRGGWGSGIGFRARVPYDYVVEEEAFAVTDGIKTEFKLYVTYKRPGADIEDVRRIAKPVVQVEKEKNSFQLLNPQGTAPRTIDNPFRLFLDEGSGPAEIMSGWTVDSKTGIAYFDDPPDSGILLGSYEFDIPAAFLPQTPQQKYDFVSSVGNVGIREIPIAEIGIAY